MSLNRVGLSKLHTQFVPFFSQIRSCAIRLDGKRLCELFSVGSLRRCHLGFKKSGTRDDSERPRPRATPASSGLRLLGHRSAAEVKPLWRAVPAFGRATLTP